jgi:diaminopimelate decarboxylase
MQTANGTESLQQAPLSFMAMTCPVGSQETSNADHCCLCQEIVDVVDEMKTDTGAAVFWSNLCYAVQISD